MTRLKSAIVSAVRFAALTPSPPACRLVVLAQELERKWSGVAELPVGIDLSAVARRFRDAISGGSGLTQIRSADWRWLPWVLWLEEPPLAAESLLLYEYEQRLRARRSRTELRALMSAYLRDYRPDRAGVRRVAALLRELVPSFAWPWAERAVRYRLFDPDEAPKAILSACLEHRDGVLAGLVEMGLEEYRHAGVGLAALKEGIERLTPSLAAGEDAGSLLPRILEWAVTGDGRRETVVPEVRVALANALLEPWSSRIPSEEVKNQIQAFLLHHYGDPRLHPQRWHLVSETARTVFLRWLVKVALDQFLGVIDEFALERHWIYRRAFWTAYHRRGEILEAHVMFASLGYEFVQRKFGPDAPCARLVNRPGPVDPKHAVLLMRIGRLIIADWSHMGSCVIWKDNNPSRPTFSALEYTRRDLDRNRADWSTTHHGAARYVWQRRIRDYIAQETGIWLNDSEFTVDQ